MGIVEQTLILVGDPDCNVDVPIGKCGSITQTGVGITRGFMKSKVFIKGYCQLVGCSLIFCLILLDRH